MAAPVTGVTDSGATARADEIRNELQRLLDEPLEPVIVERLFGGDEDAARTSQAAWFARRASYWCDECKAVFADGDVVYRRMRRGEFVDQPGLTAYCRDCVWRWHPSWIENAREPQPCPGSCGVLVSY